MISCGEGDVIICSLCKYPKHITLGVAHHERYMSHRHRTWANFRLTQTLLECTEVSSQVSVMKSTAMYVTWTSCHLTRQPSSAQFPIICHLLSRILLSTV